MMTLTMNMLRSVLAHVVALDTVLIWLVYVVLYQFSVSMYAVVYLSILSLFTTIRSESTNYLKKDSLPQQRISNLALSYMKLIL